MNKKIRIGLISFGALLSVFIIACAAIRVSEEVYLRKFEKTNTAQLFYNLWRDESQSETR